MHYTAISLDVRQQTAWLTLNRPQAMNALSADMCNEILHALEHVVSDDDIRVMVITGSGPAFCVGADLKGLLQSGADDTGPHDPTRDFLQLVSAMIEGVRKLPKPVIASLNGITMAGGLELAMACDLILAAEHARIGDAHPNFGVLPGAGGAAVLPRLIGPVHAKYLLFTGQAMLARDLVQLGLVNRVVADADLAAEAETLATHIAAKSPLVLRRMKQLVADALEQPLDAALRLEQLTLNAHRHSYDMREGLAAFVGKRKPEFKGY